MPLIKTKIRIMKEGVDKKKGILIERASPDDTF